MKLYYSPGACSLADHIALLEGGFEFELERVNLKQKTTESGADYMSINTKGYVPALRLDSGEIVTENIAVLDWIAAQRPALGLEGPMGRTRLLETLAYISTEIHKGFHSFFTGASEEDKARAQQGIVRRMRWIADRKVGKYLLVMNPPSPISTCSSCCVGRQNSRLSCPRSWSRCRCEWEIGREFNRPSSSKKRQPG